MKISVDAAHHRAFVEGVNDAACRSVNFVVSGAACRAFRHGLCVADGFGEGQEQLASLRALIRRCAPPSPAAQEKGRIRRHR
jgi:hypothetical protein